MHAIAWKGLRQKGSADWVANVTPRYGPITLKAIERGIRMNKIWCLAETVCCQYRLSVWMLVCTLWWQCGALTMLALLDVMYMLWGAMSCGQGNKRGRKESEKLGAIGDAICEGD